MLASSTSLFIALLLCQAPLPMGRGFSRTKKQVLIVPLSLPLNDPLVAKGETLIRKTLPTWHISRPSFASKTEIPRSALLLRCMVESTGGTEEWGFTLQILTDGQLKLREAKVVN